VIGAASVVALQLGLSAPALSPVASTSVTGSTADAAGDGAGATTDNGTAATPDQNPVQTQDGAGARAREGGRGGARDGGRQGGR